jgi:3-deoxy-D-manno-octulosonic-acid transferase
MDDFREEKALLEAVGCGIMVKTAPELTQMLLQELKNPAALEQKGAAGKEAVAANRGAAARYAQLIEKFLD